MDAFVSINADTMNRTSTTSNAKKRILKLVTMLMVSALTGVKAYLTTGGTVTADSLATQWLNYGVGDHPEALIDGILNTDPVLSGGQVLVWMIHSNGYDLNNSNSFFDIQLLNTAVIETVLIFHREGFQNRLAGTDFWVGMTTSSLIACNAHPLGSGLFSCGGKVGLHLRYQQTVRQYLHMGEIRAYSVQPTPASEFTTTTSTLSICSAAGENLLSWPVNGSNVPIGMISTYSTCRQSLAGGTLAFYQVNFNQSRYVHAVTVLGIYTTSSIYSKNWKLYVLVNGVYTYYGGWVKTPNDDFGKEIPIGTQTTSIRIERNDGQELRLFWMGIFSTETDCPGTLDWSDSWTTWPVILKDPSTTTTYIARAKLGGYVLTHTLKQIDDSALPSYVSYDAATQTISVKPPANTILSLQLKATASVAYDACFKSQRFFLTFDICTQTLIASPASLTLTLEIAGQVLTSPLPAVTSSLSTTLAFACDSSAPSFFKVQGSNLVIDSTATAGIFSFGITVTDSTCSATITIAANVTLYDCRPNGFTLSKSSLQLELNSAAQTITWSQTPVNSVCGTYSVTSDAPQLIQVSGQNITVSSTPAGSYIQTLTLTRQAASQSMTSTTNLQINVYDCAITGFTLTPSTVSVEFLGPLKTIAWSKDAKDPLCGNFDFASASSLLPLITVAANQTLIVKSTLLSQLSTQTITITLQRLQNTIQSATTSLQVDVYCAVPHLVFTQLAENTEVKVGIDVQPVRVPFTVDLPCYQPATFSVSNSPSFLQVELLTSSSGNIKIENATGAMHGVYKLQLTATAMTTTTETVPKDFSIFINGCSTSTFVHEIIPSIDIFIQSGQRSGEFRFNEFQHTFGMLGRDCGKNVYKLGLVSGISAPSWISVDSDNKIIKYDVFSVGKASSFAFELHASLEQYPLVAISEPFNITVASSEIKCNQLPPAIYRIGDQPATFAVSYSNQTFAPQTKLTRLVQPLFKRQGRDVTKPSFIEYNEGSFSLSSMNFEDVDSYQLGLRIGYQEFPSIQVICELYVSVEYTPTFTGDKVDDHSVTCDQPWSFTLPEYIDFEKKPARLSVDFGEAQSMFKFNQANRRIESKPAQLSGITQTFQVSIILTDSHGYSSTFTFNLQVSCRVFTEVEITPKPFKKPQLEPPKPAISQVNSSGLVRVQFTRKILVPTYDAYPELKPKTACEDSCGRMLNATSDEEQAIQIVNTAQVSQNETLLPIMELDIMPGMYSNITTLNFTWECVRFSPDSMDIKLNFTQADYVSIFSERDSIVLHYNGYQYFKSEDGQTFPADQVVKRTLAPQMDSKIATTLSFVAQTVANTSKSIIVLQFILKLLISQSLQKMFGAINKLQILTHLPLLAIAVSSNAWIFCASLVSLVNFEIYDFGPLTSRVLALEKDTPFRESFADYGYGSRYFIINLGNLFYVFFIFLSGLLLLVCLNKATHQQLVKVREKLRLSLVWSAFVEYFNEACLPISLSCLIAYSMWSFKSFGEALDQICSSSAMIAVFIAVPLFKLLYLQHERNHLHTKDIKEKFECLFEKLRYRRTRWALLEPFIGDIRRLILAITIICLQGYPTFQLMSVYFQILAVTIFNGQVEPFTDRTTNRLEQFNELTISGVFYHLLCFADLVKDPMTRINLGWSMIGSTLCCLALNFALVLFDSILSLIKRAKRYLLLKKLAKRRKRRQRIDEERQKQMFLYYEDQKNNQQESVVEDSQSSHQRSGSLLSVTSLEEVEESKSNRRMVVEVTIKKPAIEEEEPMPRDISGFKFKSDIKDHIDQSQQQSAPVLIPLAQRQKRIQLKTQSNQPIFDYRANMIIYPSQPQTVWKLDGVDREEVSDFLGMKI